MNADGTFGAHASLLLLLASRHPDAIKQTAIISEAGSVRPHQSSVRGRRDSTSLASTEQRSRQTTRHVASAASP